MFHQFQIFLLLLPAAYMEMLNTSNTDNPNHLHQKVRNERLMLTNNTIGMERILDIGVHCVPVSLAHSGNLQTGNLEN
jgi:hypothetical protein